MTTEKPTFVYVTYIESTPELVWNALTDADVTAEYWGHRNISDWQAGSPWEMQRTDGSGDLDVVGAVVTTDPPRKLVATWTRPDEKVKSPSRVTFDIEPYGKIVRLTVTHEDLADAGDHRDVATGWPAVLSNLKSLLETGHVLPAAPWEMSRASA